MKKVKLKLTSVFLTVVLCLVFICSCSSGSGYSAEQPASDGEKIGSMGEFSTEDIYGTAYTQDIFSSHSLTIVNVFATWCPPCVEELPALESLSKTMAENGLQVVGIVIDSVDGAGKKDASAIEKARELAKKSEVTYTMLIPDEAGMNGLLGRVSSIPHTFFVDENGNVVGETVGAHDLEEWTEIAKDYMRGLE